MAYRRSRGHVELVVLWMLLLCLPWLNVGGKRKCRGETADQWGGLYDSLSIQMLLVFRLESIGCRVKVHVIGTRRSRYHGTWLALILGTCHPWWPDGGSLIKYSFASMVRTWNLWGTSYSIHLIHDVGTSVFTCANVACCPLVPTEIGSHRPQLLRRGWGKPIMITRLCRKQGGNTLNIIRFRSSHWHKIDWLWLLEYRKKEIH